MNYIGQWHENLCLLGNGQQGWRTAVSRAIFSYGFILILYKDLRVTNIALVGVQLLNGLVRRVQFYIPQIRSPLGILPVLL